MLRRTFTLGVSAVATAAAISPATAQTSAANVTMAVGGKSLITYLPLTIADRLGYFKDAGLNVTISDFAGGAKSVEALVGGSADFVTAAYEHCLLLQPKGISLNSIALLTKSYGAVIALTKTNFPKYKTPADLKGMKFGVTTPGSSGSLALDILLAKANLKPDSVSVIGIGAGSGAIAAVKSGQVDGVVQFDPVVAQLLHDGDIVPIVDTRTDKGQHYLYGGYIAGSAITTKTSFIESKRSVVQAMATAIVRADVWLRSASIDAIVNAVPPEYYGQSRDLYRDALTADRPAFSIDGTIPRAYAEATYRVLSTYGPLVGVPNIDISKTYNNTFVNNALKRH